MAHKRSRMRRWRDAEGSVITALEAATVALVAYDAAAEEFTAVASDAVAKNDEVAQTEAVASAADALQTIADTTASLAAT